MVCSMTGFGRGEILQADRHMLIEMKSVNNKYADIQVRLPRILAALESQIRARIASRIRRGKVDVFINFNDMTPDASQVLCDVNLAGAYARALARIAEETGLPNPSDAAIISRFPDVLRVESTRIDADEVWQHLLEPALEQALDQLIVMRSQEGAKMLEDINQRLAHLHALHQAVNERAPEVPLIYRERLKNRIETLLAEHSAEWLDEQRLAAEVALFADKCAVDEELVRLKSHLQQFSTIMATGESMGKKLDFLVQEINREINTIGSKANDLNITNQVVQMKSELEKIREQIQNIE